MLSCVIVLTNSAPFKIFIWLKFEIHVIQYFQYERDLITELPGPAWSRVEVASFWQ